MLLKSPHLSGEEIRGYRNFWSWVLVAGDTIAWLLGVKTMGLVILALLVVLWLALTLWGNGRDREADECAEFPL